MDMILRRNIAAIMNKNIICMLPGLDAECWNTNVNVSRSRCVKQGKILHCKSRATRWNLSICAWFCSEHQLFLHRVQGENGHSSTWSCLFYSQHLHASLQFYVNKMSVFRKDTRRKNRSGAYGQSHLFQCDLLLLWNGPWILAGKNQIV